MTGRIVFFDVETSGLDPNVHEVIQLAAIAVEADGLGEIERFEAKVQFDVSKASPEALEINSYNVEAWRSAKPRPMVVGQFSNFLRQHSTVQQISRRTGRPYNVAQLAGQRAALDHLAKAAGEISVRTLQQVMADHDGCDAGHEATVCAHGPRGGTLSSMVIENASRTMWIAAGNPCAHPWTEVRFRGGAASEQRVAAK